MARALVSTIIDQLGSLIASEFKDRLGSLFASEVTSIVNVEEEVEKLKLKFQAIQAKLDDAEERQVKEKAVKLCAKNLHTLIVVGHDSYNVSKLFHRFRRLRTLSLRCRYGRLKVSDEIEDLMHLRYLKIPIWLENEWPETIDYSYHGFPRGIGRLSSLTKLSHFTVGGKDDSQRCELGELKYLNHLQGTLTINRLGNVVDACEAKNAELKKKIDLRDLYLQFSGKKVENHGRRMENDVSVLNALEPPPGLEKLQIDWYRGTTMFPNWMMSLAKLKSLTLTRGENLERSPPLGKLQFLEHLIIGFRGFQFKKVGVEFLGIESENKKDGIIKIFPNLKTLRHSLKCFVTRKSVRYRQEEETTNTLALLILIIYSSNVELKTMVHMG
nr:putative disease resistance protein [Quercus suber]